MDDGFILTVNYNGKIYELETKFVRLGYIHQFHILIDGRTLVVEFDEERNYRVIDTLADTSKPMDTELLEKIVAKVSSLH